MHVPYIVDALRDATGAAEKEGQGFGTEWTYENLETPILKHNKSFNSLFEELQEVVSSSPGATPEVRRRYMLNTVRLTTNTVRCFQAIGFKLKALYGAFKPLVSS